MCTRWSTRPNRTRVDLYTEHARIILLSAAASAHSCSVLLNKPTQFLHNRHACRFPGCKSKTFRVCEKRAFTFESRRNSHRRPHQTQQKSHFLSLYGALASSGAATLSKEAHTVRRESIGRASAFVRVTASSDGAERPAVSDFLKGRRRTGRKGRNSSQTSIPLG